jgi:hypothetical protein
VELWQTNFFPGFVSTLREQADKAGFPPLAPDDLGESTGGILGTNKPDSPGWDRRRIGSEGTAKGGLQRAKTAGVVAGCVHSLDAQLGGMVPNGAVGGLCRSGGIGEEGKGSGFENESSKRPRSGNVLRGACPGAAVHDFPESGQCAVEFTVNDDLATAGERFQAFKALANDFAAPVEVPGKGASHRGGIGRRGHGVNADCKIRKAPVPSVA